MSSSLRAVLLMGPTACGKTGLALALAERFPVEIVSVDSALVYRDMDIGTAKPTAAEMASCPHHLIDIIDPTETYSAAQFHADANRLIADICARGNIPLLVGGTMLYYKALMEGLSDLPQGDATVRAALEAEAAAHGWPAMHAQLAAIDPVTAARLAPNDSQRLARALEVCRLSGEPMSALLARGRDAAANFAALRLALVPRERQWLHDRIALRFEQMLEQGFLDEVTRVRQRYPGLSLELPSMRCVGYRQAWEYQDGQYDYEELRFRGIAATRQLAKRQLTWLRSMPENSELDCQQADLLSPVARQMEQWIAACQK
ncbi:tRNA (adenosine(37)-N6)-dimethylallyltransferase MiaA [Vogesella sp. LIG4]|uniref:tRNA (adenosine(37)-N6)-dimethylallyltransferase MiaA n=1 Tax=Vogesella sp. LIG4 TaxID=1192162 RepID=UPI00081FCE57|nr:tRNA (adenosine(37)-N6)-dimethylallyltransferase MiaA [Vogesella sp. LIG4]SCK20093.1 tRNA dimethylallyltransferase [Vogesella sp. LIG4]